MIHAIELENFKGIGARTRVDLAPVTLLFGANNAGKSTILQALLYLSDIVNHGRADLDRTSLGGDSFDLGGFRRLVHGNDSRQSIQLRIEFDCGGSLNCFQRNLDDFPLPDLDDQIERAWVEVEVGILGSPAREPAGVRSLSVGTSESETPILRLYVERLDRAAEPLRIELNVDHPLLAPGAEAIRETTIPFMFLIGGPEDPLMFAMPYGFDASAVPDVNEPVRVLSFGADGEAPSGPDYRNLCTLIELVSVGVLRQLAATLREMTYVGPLRTVPPRTFLSERSTQTTRWADGLAAWDELLANRWPLVEDTNRWLSRVGAGCQVEIQQLTDGSADAEAITYGENAAVVRRLLLAIDRGPGPAPGLGPGPRAVSGPGASPSAVPGPAAGPGFRPGARRVGTRVLPCEVGAGISQVVPVIVAALVGKRGRLVVIEQPELHVHPALQVGLGDLFIESGAERQLLIETHSEHIILRLLRRIRETHDGDLPEGAPAFKPDKLSVLYVAQAEEGTTVRRLHVDETGEFVDRWPRGFFEERTEELF